MLVHFEFSDTSVVKYEIFGIAYTVWQSLIRHIYGIFPRFRNVRHPFDKSLVLFLFGLGIAGCPGNERIFDILIYSFLLMMCSPKISVD